MTTKVTSVIEVLTKDRSSKVLQDIGRAGVSAFKLLAGASVAAVAGLGALTIRSARATDAVNELAKKTGASIEFMSGFAFAADQADVSTEQLRVGMIALARRATDMPKNFQKWGIATKDVNGNIADTETLLKRVANKIKNTESASKRLAIADSLLSEAGRQLVPLLAEGAEGLEAFRKEAERLGLIIDPLSAAIADQLNNELGKLSFQAQAFAREITTAIGPVLISLAREMQTVIGKSIKWAEANREVISDAFIGALIWMADTGIPAIATGANIVAKAFLGWVGIINVAQQAWHRIREEIFDTLNKLPAAFPKLAKALGIKGGAFAEVQNSIKERQRLQKDLIKLTLSIEGVDKALADISGKSSETLRKAIAGLKDVLSDLSDVKPPGGLGGDGGGGSGDDAAFKAFLARRDAEIALIERTTAARRRAQEQTRKADEANTKAFLANIELRKERAIAAAQEQAQATTEAIRFGIGSIRSFITAAREGPLALFQTVAETVGNKILELGLKALADHIVKNAAIIAADKVKAAIQVNLAATVAGANAAAAAASLPFVGPFAAITAGAATKAAVSGAFLPQVAAFEHGGIVPRTGLALIHKDELILPKREVASALDAGFGGRDARPSRSDVRSQTIVINALEVPTRTQITRLRLGQSRGVKFARKLGHTEEI